MIYIPTVTSKLKYREVFHENILYSPNENLPIVRKGKITIWDNYTFYLRKHLKNQEKAYNHYKWLIQFIKENYQEGITLITPDVDWLDRGEEIEELWLENCKDYPQLIVPYTWREETHSSSPLNIVGNALRKEQPSGWYHTEWTHCLGHKRENIPTKLLTYDSISEILA